MSRGRMRVVFSTNENFNCSFSENSASFVVDVAESFRPPQYEGTTDITPSNEVQILQTDGFILSDNIIIEPIPSNYGLITWDGSTLTVS